MCHGHPHYHACGHQSVTWHYCPSALIDLTTGYETPCPNITFAASQPSTSNCPLANCDFRNAGDGGWTCCKCGGRNSSGWCKNMAPEPKWEKNPITNEWEWIERCDHGCCRECVKDAPSSSSESSRKDGRKGKDGRRCRASGPAMKTKGDAMAALAAYSITLDYSGKDARGFVKKDKDVQSTSHRRK